MAELRVGTYLAPNMEPFYQGITDQLAERLGLTTELVVETDYENCRDDVNDVCFVCSLAYVMFEREGIAPAVPVAAPVLTGDRFGGRPIYFSDVIVNQSSDAAGFLDLKGRSWCYNEPLSQSGYGITRHHLLSIGETDGFFSDVVEAGFHETSIQMVANGEVEASAIDCQVLAVALAGDAGLRERLKVIDTLGPSTIQPLAVSQRFDDEFKEEVRDVLLNLHTTEEGRAILDLGGVESWVAVDASDYDDVRAMVDACEAAGFMEIR